MTRLPSSLAAAVCWLGLLLPTAAGLLPSAHAVTRMPQPAHARAGPLPVVMGRKGRPKMPAGMVRALIGIRNPRPLCVEYGRALSLSPELSLRVLACPTLFTLAARRPAADDGIQPAGAF